MRSTNQLYRPDEEWREAEKDEIDAALLVDGAPDEGRRQEEAEDGNATGAPLDAGAPAAAGLHQAHQDKLSCDRSTALYCGYPMNGCIITCGKKQRTNCRIPYSQEPPISLGDGPAGIRVYIQGQK